MSRMNGTFFHLDKIYLCLLNLLSAIESLAFPRQSCLYVRVLVDLSLLRLRLRQRREVVSIRFESTVSNVIVMYMAVLMRLYALSKYDLHECTSN